MRQFVRQSFVGSGGLLHPSRGTGGSPMPVGIWRESAANRQSGPTNGGGGIRTLVGGISPETVFETAVIWLCRATNRCR